MVVTELHHAVPRCLLRLRDAADSELPLGGHLAVAHLEFEHECERWRVPVQIAREDLQKLIERSTVVLDRDRHRLLHQSDFVRRGRRGGLTTLRRCGTDYYARLAIPRRST